MFEQSVLQSAGACCCSREVQQPPSCSVMVEPWDGRAFFVNYLNEESKLSLNIKHLITDLQTGHPGAGSAAGHGAGR